jgi:hypothetical protein
MRYCFEHGIPHSDFMDWEPEDRAKTLAYLFEEAERCQMCGTADWEWQENRHAYEPVLITCLGCYYKEIAREGQDIGPGVTVRLEKPGTIQAAQREMTQRRLARNDRAAARARSRQ